MQDKVVDQAQDGVGQMLRQLSHKDKPKPAFAPTLGDTLDLLMQRGHLADPLRGEELMRFLDDDDHRRRLSSEQDRPAIRLLLRLLNTTQQVADDQVVDQRGVAVGEIEDRDTSRRKHADVVKRWSLRVIKE